MKKFLSKKTFMLVSLMAMMLTLLGTIALNAIEYKPLPSRPYFNGFYYWLDRADYPNMLQSNVPLDVLIGYIVADSAVRAIPYSNAFIDSAQKLNPFSDTAQYIFKYWYLMNEYDPLWFYSFLKREQQPGANATAVSLHSPLRHRMSLHPKSVYVTPHYILQVYVNNTVSIDNTDARDRYDVNSKTIAYCKVLDTLKGGKFPSLNNAIFYDGERPKPEEGGIVDNTYAEALFPAITPDIVFSYLDDWQRWAVGPPLNNKIKGDNWIKPGREYIVFLEPLGMDAKSYWEGEVFRKKCYYALIPYPHPGSLSMYPIEDGYVLDETNALGFGTKVPVEEFKQNIRTKIAEIKNYGE